MRVSKYWPFLIAREQWLEWALMLVMTILGGVFIHICYPYPDTMQDSFGYLRAAIDDEFSMYRPFGYSAFLQVLHVFSHSINAVLVGQLLVSFLSSTMLVLALKCYFPLHKMWMRVLLVLGVCVCPTALYMSNCIMSDVLFMSEVYLMLAMVMVMLCEQSWTAMVIYLLVFTASLFTRYSAMFFPVAFIPLLCFVKKPVMRYVSILLTCLCVLVFYQNVKKNMYDTMHLRQFSTGFDGWQWANNGLHVVPFLEDEDLRADAMPTDHRVRQMHQFCVRRFDDQLLRATDNGTKPTALMIWSREMPLKQYMFYYMQTMQVSYPVAWAKLGGGLYADYGKWLILHYPGLFMQHYLLPNIVNMFLPRTYDIIGAYANVEAGKAEIVDWFNLSHSTSLEARYPVYEKFLKHCLPWIELLTWLVFVLGLVLLIVRRASLSLSREQWLLLALVIAFGFVYYGSTTFASPVVVRYWMPMHILKFVPLWIYLYSRNNCSVTQ